jgi:hypothetical protein
MALTGVPSTRTPYFAKMPASSSSRPQLRAVCPPKEQEDRVDLFLDDDLLDEVGASPGEVDLVGEVRWSGWWRCSG